MGDSLHASRGEVVTVPVVRLAPKALFGDGLHGLAGELWWHAGPFIPGDETTPLDEAFLTQHPGTVVHWIEDPKTGVNHVAIAGPMREQVAAELRAIEDGFYSIRELLELSAATSLEDKTIAIYYLALVAPDAMSPEIFEVFKAYLEDADPALRGAAVLAISYLGWPELIPFLQRRVTEDPDLTVREDAQILLENMRKYPARSLVVRARD